MSDKIREEFELAYVANIQEHLGGPIPKGVLDEYVVRGSDGEYRSYQAQGAWWGWQACRESLVIRLPEGKSLAELMYGPQAKGGDELIAREIAVDAIQAAGIKVIQ